MTDNINYLKKIMDFGDDDKFYYLQILARKKDNPDGKSVKTVKDYYISNEKYFDEHVEQIKELCDLFNARAYLRLNRRSWEQVARKMNVYMAKDVLENKNYPYSRKVFSKACGRTHCEENAIWIIDLDRDDFHSWGHFENTMYTIETYIKDLIKKENVLGRKIIGSVETPNGVHILTNPFNRKKFNEVFDNIDIHDNNPTILYAP